MGKVGNVVFGVVVGIAASVIMVGNAFVQAARNTRRQGS